MTTTQFSDEFDILINSQAILKQFGLTQGIELDEYEKSLFLTYAQEELVRNLYRGNQADRNSFEETELQRRYLDKLIKQATVTSIVVMPDAEKIEGISAFFQLPADVMVITLERLKVTSLQTCYNNKVIDVIPITQDTYLTQSKNPFRSPSMKGRTNQAWRLDYGNNVSRVVEILPPAEVTANSYIVRYLRKPNPIILTTLDNNLAIDGKTTVQTSELDDILHRQILQLAVIKALQTKTFTQQENK